jgi:hypothetical protein
MWTRIRTSADIVHLIDDFHSKGNFIELSLQAEHSAFFVETSLPRLTTSLRRLVRSKLCTSENC